MNNKKLLIALFTATFSGIVFAEQSLVSHDFIVDQKQHCESRNTENCQKLAILFAEVQQLIDEHGVVNWTEEQLQQRQDLFQAIVQEMMQEGMVNIKTILEEEGNPVEPIFEQAAEQAEVIAQEIAEALQPSHSQE